MIKGFVFRNVHLRTQPTQKCIHHVSSEFVSPIYLNIQVDVIWNILSHMCTIASFINGWFLWIIWNVIGIHSVFFPSVMVQLLWIIWGTFSICSWLVCLPLRFILVMFIIAWCSIVSHDAAQRQRTEVIFLFLNFTTQKFGSITLTTEPREKTYYRWWEVYLYVYLYAYLMLTYVNFLPYW